MILVSAQMSPKRFDISPNLNEHYKLIELAAKKGADIILWTLWYDESI